MIGSKAKFLACNFDSLFITAGGNPFFIAFLGDTIDEDSVGWNAMSPPKLTGDAPWANVFVPALPINNEFLWVDLEIACFDCLKGAFGHALCVNEPLLLDDLFDNISTSLGDAETHFVIFFTVEEVELLKPLGNCNTRVETWKACKFWADVVNLAIFCEDIGELQVVAKTGFKVVWIVGRRNLNNACTEVHVDELVIEDDWDGDLSEWVVDSLSVEVGVARVFAVDGDGLITEERFETGCGNEDCFVGWLAVVVGNLVFEVGENAEWILLEFVVGHLQKGALGNGDVFDFGIGNGGLESTVPVN
ncbi:hypothetical protein TRFO_05156 [Tritrichomonas foetus]|uniref:Uncharacterized protein n=1 Tax=Tritrichomonas foetus TaxID=1144522 RepID=A0A1J4KCV0_9EUKA|nr:hypothetical protein TRFO_05156 [Tritrichomonas foetus]|eukprot:OHT07532.1 hypothetical protein TRFO_05156 [Tritrichomonas foetus]